MAKKIIVLDSSVKSGKINVWWKIGNYFIHQENIRSLKRMGKRTRLSFFKGEDLIVKVSYDKLQELLPSGSKAI